MKIAILTLPLHTNYGGILQAYALQTVLERMGHQVVVLDLYTFYRVLPLWKKPFSYTKRFFEKYLFKKIDVINIEKHINLILPIIRQHTQQFIDQYIHYDSVDRYSSIKEKRYDAIIVGSDQVWRPSYFRKNIKQAYLYFAKDWNIRRIAYAPSFGTDYWEYSDEQTAICADLLAKFDAVSVREESALGLVREKLGRDAVWVLDPTMLLTKDDYIRLFQSKTIPSGKGNLMVYVLDWSKTVDAYIKKLETTYSFSSFITNSIYVEKLDSICSHSCSCSLEDYIQPPVENWLQGFDKAELVVTDSFHACVFSLLFNKPFIVLRNSTRGNTRIDSLLGLFNQKHRIVDDISRIQLTDAQLAKPNVLEKIDYLKTLSLNFIDNALKE